MKTIVLCAFKGGSCRTSSSLHLGASLAKFHGKRVLLVDFDAQANLSMGLGFGADQERGIVAVLQEKMEIQAAINETKIP